MSNNRLNRAVSFLMAAILCVLSVFVCYGADKSYIISEINDMNITLPDDITTVTRSSKADDKYFSLFGLDYDTTMNNLKNGNIYLQGMDNNSSYTVTVTMTQTDDSKAIANYNLLQPDKLNEVSGNFLSQSEYSACTADSSYSIVWLYLAANVDSNGKKIKTYQANTVYDGKNINIIIQRNGGDVVAQDYDTLNSIVSNVVFNKGDTTTYTILFLIIGATLLIILIIVVLVMVAKRLKRKRRSRRNDKIIEELAGKYTSHGKPGSYDDDEKYEQEINTSDMRLSENISDDEEDLLENAVERPNAAYNEAMHDTKYSEDEINEILVYRNKAAENKIEAADIKKAENELLDNVTIAKTEQLSENDNTQVTDNNIQEEKTEQVDFTDETGIESDDEFEEYVNDEELVRQDAKQAKFNSSYDFFDEAPKKTMGVLSRDEIRDAEDYDVINEVEKRASEVEKPESSSVSSFAATIKTMGAGIKSFFIHCGYFATNVSRMIKHKHAVKKRKKAEEERRRRAKMRAQRQRQQRMEMENGGLVQVHKRSSGRTTGRSNSHPTTASGSYQSRNTNTRPVKRPNSRR